MSRKGPAPAGLFPCCGLAADRAPEEQQADDRDDRRDERDAEADHVDEREHETDDRDSARRAACEHELVGAPLAGPP